MKDSPLVPALENKQPLPMRSKFGPAAAAALVTHAFMHPYDTIIRRGQIFPHPINTKNFHLALFGNAGPLTFTQKFHSLCKGFISAGVYHFITRTIKVSKQEDAVEWLSNLTGGIAEAYLDAKLGKIVIQAAAASLVDLAVTVVTFPLDTYKIKRQNHNTMPIMRLMWTENLKLYNGLSAMIARNVPGSAALFGTSYAILTVGFDLDDTKKATSNERSFAALFGGVAAAVVTNPQDTLKTRLQTDSHLGTFSVFKQAMREEGLWALLTKGLILRTLKVAPTLALPLILTGYFEQLWTQPEARLPVEKEMPKQPMTRRLL